MNIDPPVMKHCNLQSITNGGFNGSTIEIMICSLPCLLDYHIV